ncbi:unnamed protein product, partial [Rotaria sordida]
MPTASMSTYKLYYFNGGGRAEVSRLIFAAVGKKYEDIRYERNEWSSHKSEMPLGQMPVLEVDGTKLPQSLSIARFLAKQFQLAEKYVSARWEPDETKRDELTKKFLAEELPKHLQNLETLGKLYGNGGPFFVGNYLTWADLYFYDILETLLYANENCLNNYAWLKQNRAEVEKQPKVAEYLK